MVADPGVDVWGVSSGVFLVGYWAAAAAIVAPAFLHLLASRLTVRHCDPLSLRPPEIGYLSSGGWGAIFVSLARLRALVVIGADHGLLRQTGLSPRGTTALDRAVYRAAGRTVPPWRLQSDPDVARRLHAIRMRLESGGLATRSASRRWLLWGAGGLTIVGVARLFTVLNGGRRDLPLTYSVMGVLALALVIGYLLARPVTRSGEHALDHLRGLDHRWTDAGHDHRWSMATYADGADAIAMRVALGGPRALREIDPVFADAIGMTPRRLDYNPTAGGGGPTAGYHGGYLDPFTGTGEWGGGGFGGGGGDGGGGGGGG